MVTIQTLLLLVKTKTLRVKISAQSGSQFGPRGVLIPGSSAAASAVAQDKGDTTADDTVVNKEPAVPPESAEVVTAVHDAYVYLGNGKVEEA